MQDTWKLGGHEFTSRFILGSGKYDLNLIKAAVEDAGAQIITLALRRANTGDTENILDYIPKGVTLLPNTSGARNAEEAANLEYLAERRLIMRAASDIDVVALIYKFMQTDVSSEYVENGLARAEMFSSSNTANYLAAYAGGKNA